MPAASAPPSVEVRTAADLQADAALAQRQQTPLLIAFFASYCEWCERVEDEFLRPLLLNADYRGKVIIRKLITDGHADLVDFDGRQITPGRLAYRYDAYLTPTLILVDHQGRELTERLVGLTTPEMYGGYLDLAIDQAQVAYRRELAGARRLD